MKTWNQFVQEAAFQPQNPGTPVQDRSLAMFPTILNQLQMAAKSVTDPTAQKMIGPLITQFSTQLNQVIANIQQQQQLQSRLQNNPSTHPDIVQWAQNQGQMPNQPNQ